MSLYDMFERLFEEHLMAIFASFLLLKTMLLELSETIQPRTHTLMGRWRKRSMNFHEQLSVSLKLRKQNARQQTWKMAIVTFKYVKNFLFLLIIIDTNREVI